MRADDIKLPHSDRVKKWGHRKYIGGAKPELWYGIGKRQYHFLVSQGLTSDKKFLDVACGSLRLGQFLIPALDAGNYYGIEGEKGLVEAGIKEEFLFDVIDLKKPKFAFNYDFELSFCDGYDFAIAQSLFSHLTLQDIEKCFRNMRKVANANSQFFFTFNLGNKEQNQHDVSHANLRWDYAFEDLEPVATAAGFDCTYIGDWGHERGQVLARAVPKA